MAGLRRRQQLKEFGSEVDKVDRLGDQEKHDYLSGLVNRIDVRWNEAEREHDLTIQLHLPIVKDGIKYTGKVKGGWREYKIVDGESTTALKVKKKDGRG